MQTKKVALVIGVSRYRDRAIPPLEFAANDAVRLARRLFEAGWSVYLLVDEDSLSDEDRDWLRQNSGKTLSYLGAPTRAGLERALRTIAEILRTTDEFLFHYSGHGFTDKSQHYLSLGDTLLDDLNATAFSVGQLREWLRNRCSKAALLVDACRNTYSRSLQQRASAEAFTRELAVLSRETGIATIAACRPGELAYEDPKLRHGVFTYAVLEALEGRAANSFGEITVLSLSEYLLKRVPQLAEGRQNPYIEYAGSETLVIVAGRTPSPLLTDSSVTIEFNPHYTLRTRRVDLYVNGRLVQPDTKESYDWMNHRRTFTLQLEPKRYRFLLSVQGDGAMRAGGQRPPLIGPQEPTGKHYNVHFMLDVRTNHRVFITAHEGVRNNLEVSVTIDGRKIRRNKNPRAKEPDLNTFCVEFL